MNAPELTEQEVNNSLEQFVKPERVFRRASGDLERRAKPRLQERFPARIWGVGSRQHKLYGSVPANASANAGRR